MQIEDLPLLDLFNRLRQAGLQLGLGEYQLVLKALQSGFGLSDRKALANLCCTVWVKSAEDKRIFDYHFQQLMNQSAPDLGLEKKKSSQEQKTRIGRGLSLLISAGVLVFGLSLIDSSHRFQRMTPFSSNLSSLMESSANQLYQNLILLTLTSQNSTTLSVEEPVIGEPAPTADGNINQPAWLVLTGFLILMLIGIIRYTFQCRTRTLNLPAQTAKPPVLNVLPAALTHQIEDEVQVARIRQVIATGDYFPVTRRQMKQSWRCLRHMVRQGPPTELDVDATVHAIGRQGNVVAACVRSPPDQSGQGDSVVGSRRFDGPVSWLVQAISRNCLSRGTINPRWYLLFP